jgi:hypothetical protein
VRKISQVVTSRNGEWSKLPEIILEMQVESLATASTENISRNLLP